MIWTSITRKLEHFTHILLAYLGYESNLYLPSLLVKISTLLFFSFILVAFV